MKLTSQTRSGRYYIEGATHEEVEQAHWSFYNHEATNTSELHWIGDTCGWFTSYPEKLLRGMENIALAEILNNRSDEFKKKKGGALAEAKRIAKERFDAIENEPRYAKTPAHIYHSGTLQKETFNDFKEYILARAFKP